MEIEHELKSMVKDLPIWVPRSADSFSFQLRAIDRAKRHATILRLNKRARLRLIGARKEESENFLFLVEGWMTNLEKLTRAARPGDIAMILQDLEETRGRLGRSRLKHLPGVQDSA